MCRFFRFQCRVLFRVTKKGKKKENTVKVQALLGMFDDHFMDFRIFLLQSLDLHLSPVPNWNFMENFPFMEIHMMNIYSGWRATFYTSFLFHDRFVECESTYFLTVFRHLNWHLMSICAKV